LADDACAVTERAWVGAGVIQSDEGAGVSTFLSFFTRYRGHAIGPISHVSQVRFLQGAESPWQRGTNENTNGLLEWSPKGTDLAIHSPARLLEVATELNNRPRTTLGGITPAQAMQRLLPNPEKPIVATSA